MSERRRRPQDLRSHRWFGVADLRAFGHRSRAKQMGYAAEAVAGDRLSLHCAWFSIADGALL